MSIAQQNQARIAAIFDFDGTLVPNINFADRQPHPQIEAMITEMQGIKDAGGVIIGNTGRPPELINGDITGLAELPFDYACSSVGTVILQPVERNGVTTLERMPEYDDYLSTPLDPNKKPYNKTEVDALLAAQDGFRLQEEYKIGDSPRSGLYYTFELPETALTEGKPNEDGNALISAKIAEIKEQVSDLLGIGQSDGIDAKCGVSKEGTHGTTVTLNVDAMSAKADKIGATQWLLDHIAQQRGTENAITAVVVAGDSSNDRSNMDTQAYLDRGLQPAFVVPGNGHPDLKTYVESEREKGAIAAFAAPIPSELHEGTSEYFNHPNYGLGGTLQGMQSVIKQLNEKVNAKNISTPDMTVNSMCSEDRVIGGSVQGKMCL
jgi:hydroxymethylpyrimidine pyrophosphatase-like HAD family hydrolase